MLTGCVTPKKELVYVTEYEYVVYDIPKQLTTPCRPGKPIDIDTYSNLSDEEKQTYLTNYIVTLMGDLKKCDNKVRSIDRYIKDINAISKRS